MVRIVDLDSKAALPVLIELRENPSALLVGSAISLWAPSNLPTGQEFSNAAFSFLFEGHLEEDERETVFSLVSKLPFEHLMSLCPSQSKARALVNELYGSSNSNKVHRMIASALQRGSLSGVITTNYDLCLEAALKSVGVQDLKRVVAHRDQVPLGNRPPLLFKIHGSAEADYQDTTVFTLYGEGALPEWKRRTLRSMLRKKILFVVGYSGLDFEICPEILRIPDLRIVWNARTPDFPSVNAEQILTEKDGVLLSGDLSRCLSKLWGYRFEAQTRVSHGFVTNAFRALFSEVEIDYWRIEVLTSIGAAKLVSRELRSRYTNGNERLPYRSSFSRSGRGVRRDSEASFEGWHLAQSLFNVGKYRTSADLFLGVAAECQERGDHLSAANILLDASDAFRAFGDCRKSLFQITKAGKIGSRAVSAKARLKTLMIVRDIKFEGGTDLAKLPFGFDVDSDWIRNTLIAVGSETLTAGRWDDFQQIGSLATELGLADGELAKSMAFEPPAADRGYTHLGFYLPQLRVFRAAWLSSLTETSVPVASEKINRLALEHLEVCAAFGLAPGIWKLHALLMEEKRRRGIFDHTHARLIVSNFLKCEHTFSRSRTLIRAFFLRDLLVPKSTRPGPNVIGRFLQYARL